MASFNASFFDSARKYISSLSIEAQAKIAAAINMMRLGDFRSVSTKKLRGTIRELIVGDHRLVYFRASTTLYFTDAFRKKTAKTPVKYIDDAAKKQKQIKE